MGARGEKTIRGACAAILLVSLGSCGGSQVGGVEMADATPESALDSGDGGDSATPADASGDATVADGTVVDATLDDAVLDGSGDACDMTASVTWSSSAPSVATVTSGGSDAGIAATLSPGTTTIQASVGATSATATLTVQD